MRQVFSNGLIAAALGTTLIAAGVIPASSQVARPQSVLATGDSVQGDLLTLARGGGGGGRGGGGGGFGGGGGGGIGGGGAAIRSGNIGGGNMVMRDRGRATNLPQGLRRDNRWDNRNDFQRRQAGWNGGRWDGDRWNNRCWNGRCSALLGSSVAFGYGAYASDYYDDSYGANDAVAYCMSRFRSYDPSSGTYIGSDGRRRPCP